MASESCVVDAIGACTVELEITGHRHNNSKLYVMPKLVSDIVVGHDIMGQYEKLVIMFGGIEGCCA